MKWNIEVGRFRQTDDLTLGRLTMGGEIIGWTLELPWRGNERLTSCIPVGTYPARLRNGAAVGSRFKYLHVELLEVPDRSAILMHAGNRVQDSSGCLLVGTRISNDETRVESSMAALNDLILRLAAIGRAGTVRVVSGVTL